MATYKVTGAGNTVIESFAGGTQPRMRAKEVNGNRLSYEFEGGSNIDVARTSHMHNMHWEFVGPGEVKAAWHNWKDGKDDGHVGAMHIRRKK